MEGAPENNQFPSEEEVLAINHFTEEVMAYEPSNLDQFLTLKDGQYQRLMFESVDLREREEEELDKFRDFCKENNITIPQGYDDEKRFVLRVLQGKKFKHDITAGEILSHAEWKEKTYPLQYDPVKQMLSEGVIYGHKRDKQMRPVIIVNCAKILEREVSFRNKKDLIDLI